MRERFKQMRLDVKTPLERELMDLARWALGPKRALMLIDVLGWGGRSPKTLAEIGREHAVSAERVRQIRVAALADIAQRGPELPVLAAVESLLREAVPVAEKVAVEMLRAAGLTDSPRVVGMLKAWGRLEGLTVADIGDCPVLMSPEDIQKTTAVQAALRGAEGPCSTEKFSPEGLAVLKAAGAVRVSPDGCWALGAVADSMTKRRVAKILAVDVRPTEETLAAALQVPADMLDFVLAGCGHFEDGGFVATPNLGAHLTPVEESLVGLLRGLGGQATRTQIEEVCACRPDGAALLRLLGKAPVFVRRLGRGRYALAGEENNAAPQAGLLSWSDDGGGLSLLYLISESMLKSGVASLPSGTRALVGSAPCLAGDDGVLGNLRTMPRAISGLRRVLVALKARAGDQVRVTREAACWRVDLLRQEAA